MPEKRPLPMPWGFALGWFGAYSTLALGGLIPAYLVACAASGSALMLVLAWALRRRDTAKNAVSQERL